MHEYAICEDLVDAAQQALSQLDSQPQRVRTVRIAAGALHQIVPDYLMSAFTFLTREGPLAGAALHIRSLPVRGRCRTCGWEGQIAFPRFQCAACDAFDLDVVQGRELILESIEVDEA